MNLITRLSVWITDRYYQSELKKMEVYTMTYKLMKRIIEKGDYDKEKTMQKLDVFLMADRITIEEYQELVEMIGGNKDE